MTVPIEPTSTELSDYLASTEVINWRNTAVAKKSAELAAGISDELALIKTLFEWVRDTIPHTADINGTIVTCSATEVLEAGTGICYAKSHLLAALLRAQNIPCGFCYQLLCLEDETSEKFLHGLNGVYLPSLKHWIRLDPRGNTGQCNAQFSVAEEQLAYIDNPAWGECLYPEVFAEPVAGVVQALQRYERREDLWENLPTAL